MEVGEATASFEIRRGALQSGVLPAFDTVTLDVDLAGECTASVELEFIGGKRRVVRTWIPFRRERGPLELFVGPSKGALASVRVTPSADQKRAVELFELRLELRGMPAPANEPDAGDEGLVQLDGVRRRVWAAPPQGSLELRLDIPDGARFQTRAWALPGAPRAEFPECRIRVVPRYGAARLFVGQPVPPKGPESRASILFDIDLSDLAEDGADLLLDGGGSSVLWETPMLLPNAKEHAANTARPNVFLITLDTTRADYAASADLAPNLAQLGREGLVFTNAWSPSNSTTPAHGSIFTGLMPHEHGAIAVGKFGLPSEVTTLAERLQTAGYVTGGFTSVEHIDAAHGFGQGFDVFLDGEVGGSRDGRVALAAAKHFLDANEGSGAPVFVWLHLFDAHTPYVLPADVEDEEAAQLTLPNTTLDAALPDWARKQPQLRWLPDDEDADDLRAHYAQGVHFTDRLLGAFLDELKAKRRFANSMIAVTADHGEGLGERGIFASHVSLLPPVLRVPLIVKMPPDYAGSLPRAGTSINTPVSTLGLTPTILDAVGLLPENNQGRNFAGASRFAADRDAVLWFESDRLAQVARLDDGHLAIGTLRATALHNSAANAMVQPGHHEAFDLQASDPLATELVEAGQAPPELEDWLLEAAHRALMQASTEDLELTLPPETLERLRALGYLE